MRFNVNDSTPQVRPLAVSITVFSVGLFTVVKEGIQKGLIALFDLLAFNFEGWRKEAVLERQTLTNQRRTFDVRPVRQVVVRVLNDLSHIVVEGVGLEPVQAAPFPTRNA